MFHLKKTKFRLSVKLPKNFLPEKLLKPSCSKKYSTCSFKFRSGPRLKKLDFYTLLANHDIFYVVDILFFAGREITGGQDRLERGHLVVLFFSFPQFLLSLQRFYFVVHYFRDVFQPRNFGGLSLKNSSFNCLENILEKIR